MSRINARSRTVSVDWKAVGRRIRELRGFDMTQADLAHRIGVSQGYLSTVEHGQGEIGGEVLLALGREFKRSVEWLLTGKEQI
jgi:transcriptional regulator with XRE-family HTH domain